MTSEIEKEHRTLFYREHVLLRSRQRKSMREREILAARYRKNMRERERERDAYMYERERDI
jgi:hypothetical protein